MTALVAKSRSGTMRQSDADRRFWFMRTSPWGNMIAEIHASQAVTSSELHQWPRS
jgi:hypothetical protein